MKHILLLIYRYGEFLHCFGQEGDGEGQLKQPWGIACDFSGYIYVCDKGNNRIQVRVNATQINVQIEPGNLISGEISVLSF